MEILVFIIAALLLGVNIVLFCINRRRTKKIQNDLGNARGKIKKLTAAVDSMTPPVPAIREVELEREEILKDLIHRFYQPGSQLVKIGAQIGCCSKAVIEEVVSLSNGNDSIQINSSFRSKNVFDVSSRKRPVSVGESLLPYFREHLGDLVKHCEVHVGDPVGAAYPETIDALLIDSGEVTTKARAAHLVNAVYSKLETGSVIICSRAETMSDCWLIWAHQRLADQVTPVWNSGPYTVFLVDGPVNTTIFDEDE